MDIQRLKERKKKLKVSTNEIAYLAELPYGTASKIFTGETKNPSYITIDKIDKALAKLEQKARLKKYFDEMSEYFKEHPDIQYDDRYFEKYYREKYHLTDDPIPYAVPKYEITDGNLAVIGRKHLSVDEYMRLDTDRWTELIDGKMVRSEAPSFEHQNIVQGIGFAIQKYIYDHKGTCKVNSAGVNVYLDEADDTLLIPDIIVICENGSLTEYGVLGAPDWIIEVTSPSTRARDYRDKMMKYMIHGVREYWVVDLQKRIVVTYLNDLPAITSIYQFSDDIPVFVYENKLTIRIDSMSETGGI